MNNDDIEKEGIQFLQYQRVAGTMCAIWKYRYGLFKSDEICMNKESMLTRLQNLKAINAPCGVSQYIIDCWPPE